MATQNLSPLSFEKALEMFKSKSGLTSKEVSDMGMTTLTDLQRTLSTMQRSQQDSRKMKYLRRLQPFLDAMEQYGKVIDTFLNTSNFVAFVWGPVKFLLLTVSNVAEAFNALLDGYATIGEQMPLLVQYRQLFEQNVYMQNALALMFEDIMDFHIEAVKLFKQKTWKQLFHATQRTLMRRIEEATRSMRRHKTILESQATIIQYEEFRASHALMKAEFAEIRATEKNERLDRVQNWLGLAADSLSRHEDIKKIRFRNTGQWLIDHTRFQNWFSPDRCIDPLLWLHGMPGAGKTVLASRVIDEVRNLKGTVAVHFYCKESDSPKAGQAILMKSMISQILTSNLSILDFLHNEMTDSREAILVSLELIQKLLRISLQSCKKVYIVIDGLDEYPRDSRKGIASWFKRLIEDVPRRDQGSIRCLFVSQDDGPGRKDLSMLSQIKITSTENGSDIKVFCADWHRKIESKFGALVDPIHHVSTIVSARAEGMFLYAKLVLWNLYEQTSRADFEVEMRPESVPAGLDEAYNRIVTRLLGPQISTSRRNSITRLLGWLTCAKRPMKWYEIQAAVTIDVDEGSYSAKLRFEEDCKDICASLVDISSDQTVTLVHSTTKDFLIRNTSVSEPRAHHDLAQRCILYLNMPEFEPPETATEIKTPQLIQTAYLKGNYAFMEYAVCFWPFHVEFAFKSLDKAHTDELETLAELLDAFLETHWIGSGKLEVPSPQLKRHMAYLKARDMFENACTAVATAKSWQRPLGKNTDENRALRLPGMVAELRKKFERIISSTELDDHTMNMIYKHYGKHHYKCGRLNCQFFHRGFATESQRAEHTAKHDRSFTCARDGCFHEIFGFATSDGLRKHTIEVHGVALNSETLEFPDEESVLTRKDETVSSRFKCQICNKTFSRAYNLKSHERTHVKERPFGCSQCEMTFPRKSDAVRHEQTHSSEKRFVCGGTLEDGGQWGCGRSFARTDALALHFRSQAGRVCITPLAKAQNETAQALLQSAEDQTLQSEVLQMSSQKLVESLLLPPFHELPSPVLMDKVILPDVDWTGYDADADAPNQWATDLSQAKMAEDHDPVSASEDLQRRDDS